MKICIVGSGTSGWMSALAIHNKIPDADITIISPENKPTIGVGEATVPYVASFIKKTLGLEESEWMKECNATYKLSLKFNNFTYQKDKNDEYFHVFNYEGESISAVDWIIKDLYKDDKDSIGYSGQFLSAELSKRNKFDKKHFGSDWSYNFDAEKFGLICKRKVEAFAEINTNFVASVVESNKGIDYLVMSDDAKIEADLFIDCTGFASVLHRKTLGGKFISWSDYLPNNKAIATRVPRDPNSEIPVYTSCYGLDNGWSWSVPLWNRDGMGYVYSDKYTTSQQAEQELKELIDVVHGENTSSELVFKHIDFGDSVGYTPEPWIKNCVAVGLTSVFIEPLESSALWCTCTQIDRLIDVIRVDENINASRINVYNKLFSEMALEIKDFIVLHYSSVLRGDSEYWKDIRLNQKMSPELIEELSRVRSNDWGSVAKNKKYFDSESWILVCISQNVMGHSLPSSLSWQGVDIDKLNDGEKTLLKSHISFVEKHTNTIKNKNKSIASDTQSHRDYLTENVYSYEY